MDCSDPAIGLQNICPQNGSRFPSKLSGSLVLITIEKELT
jgi:hypothetical protein